ncbi:MAG: fumarate hydratase [Acidobacteria bacterium]|nr:fumarate hydratase [Acidobacteriota bacterium]
MNYTAIEDIAKELYIFALKTIPPDVTAALERAAERETSESARNILKTILKNIEVAAAQPNLVCQDTGLPIYKVRIGTGCSVDGLALKQAIVRGCERATIEHPLRSSIVHPLNRKNNQTSSGEKMPAIDFDFHAADYIEITMIPKGSGSENMSFIKMCLPAEGIDGIKRFVVESVFNSGGNPCPPTIIGVGIGGTADLCLKLAKDAIARPLGTHNPDPEVAKLEDELLEMVNRLGIGPMGLGGATTCIGVNVEMAYTHMTMNPVAVNTQCWAARRAVARIWPNGEVKIGY